jgi:hypothetical protein
MHASSGWQRREICVALYGDAGVAGAAEATQLVTLDRVAVVLFARDVVSLRRLWWRLGDVAISREPSSALRPAALSPDRATVVLHSLQQRALTNPLNVMIWQVCM